MTIDEAIVHAREQSVKQLGCGEFSCANQHKQLADWLEELKLLRRIMGDQHG